MIQADHDSTPTFHLGLTMAGAVSAGCYSAGVIDYLFEILDLWEKAKHQNSNYHFDQRLIPQHRVVIEAMGGASAGGMTTMMSALYALSNSVNPVKKPLDNIYENKNILYDCWVHLNDKSGNETFNQLWELTDIEKSNGKLFSLLNSEALDEIAKRTYSYYGSSDFKTQVDQLPSYISKDLEILLSHTVLRGIALEVDFSTFTNELSKVVDEVTIEADTLSHSQYETVKKLQLEFDKSKPTHTSYEHALISHFKLNNGIPLTTQKYFWLNPNDEFERKRMINATIATGAFPVGLKFRKLSKENYSEEYIKSILKRSIFSDFGKEDPDTDHKLLFHNFPEDYETITIDGGAVNNEPYSEVASIVREKSKNETYKGLNYGIVMIDPFPDMVDSQFQYKEETDLIDAIPSILGTLQDQSKLKRKEMIDNVSHTYVKGQIYPKRHIYNHHGKVIGEEKYPIASGSFNAFGGFLDSSFRVHDFFLGRDNARNFFRYFFSIPYNKKNPHPIHKDWTEEMINVFGFVNKRDQLFYLPIIPDLNLLIAHGLDQPLTPEKELFILEHKHNLSGIEKGIYTVKERPKFDPAKLFAVERKIKIRLKKILEITKTRVAEKVEEPKEKDNPNTAEIAYAEWLKQNRFNTPWRRFKSFLLRILINVVFWFTKKSLAKKLREAIIKLIVKDLIERDLISKPK